MAIRDIAPDLLHHIQEQSPVIEHNHKVLCILEGDLMRYVQEHLARELKPQSLEDALPRVAPINFYKKIIDGLAKIYQQSVQRRIVDGNDRDQELLEQYEDVLQLNCNLNIGNEYFNAFKNNLNQVFMNGDPDNGMGRPDFRPIPNDKFYLYSIDEVDPTRPTHIVLPFGKKQKWCGPRENDYRSVDVWKVYSDDEIVIMDSDGDISPDEMSMGLNPFGLDMFMYVNRSKTRLNPIPDSDSLQMSVLLPVLVSDLNFAVKYMSYSIVYGIDVDDKNLTRSPNAFWHLKSDPKSDKTPQVGQIKPQIDIQAAMQLIISELSMWLNSKNIRPGSVSDVSAENMVSGISKMVDEMDTSDERKKQVERYKMSEELFWNGQNGMSGLLHNIHPLWVASGQIIPNMRMTFSQNARVEVSFPEQLPMMKRSQLIGDLIAEMNAGFVSRTTAMGKLNPEWSEKRIDEEIEMIDESSEVTVQDEIEQPMPNGFIEDDQENVDSETADRT